MKIAVYYYSKGGSTKKLAEAVAEAAGVKARTVDEPLEGPYELMFIGGAPYIASQVDPHLRDFVKKLTAEDVKEVAVFSASNWKMSIERQIERDLADPEIKVFDRGFTARGHMGGINKKHPTPEECAEAAEYAKKVIAALSNDQ